ncbi:S1 domain [Arabidopsis suecica]|uniref:S1 domain n=1 Tax=Arabidopsis suecica TaxID=45249 RepID=A0A8T2H1X5_ARASU|nr:S1 domain [Arabidopsis suecica]
MDVLALSSSASAASLAGNLPLFTSRVRVRRNRENLFVKQKKFLVSASKREEPKLNEWDQMELNFGRLLGEDPKLTLAKIVARKVDPEASFIEIEKSFYKNKGKMPEVEEIPLDWSKDKKKTSTSSLDGLKLVKPVLKDGVKFEKPVMKKPSPVLKKPLVEAAAPKVQRLPNVILRKPSSFYTSNDDDEESKLRLKPNLTLKMRNERENERFSDMTLLRKPEPVSVEAAEESSEDKVIPDGLTMEEGGQEDVTYSEYTLLEKPEARPKPENLKEEVGDSGAVESSEIENNSIQKPEARPEPENVENNVGDSGAVESLEIENNAIPTEMQLNSEMSSGSSEEKTVNSDPIEKILSKPISQTIVEASLQGKPQRLDPSSAEPSALNSGQPLIVNHEGRQVSVELKGPPTRSSLEENDWNKAESLVKTELRADVELISSSTRGFAVSYGSLIGFLPYRNLAAKWKFLAFESWLRRKGVDPSLYRQNLGVIGGQDVTSKAPSPDSSLDSEVATTINGEVSSDMKLEDLLMIYDREKQKFLSSFVGQKIKVNVVMANRNSRKLIFSMRPRENEEEVEKKRNLMAKLRVGDVVKCCIKKITYFGIFCELEGVPALVHQSEVSWDATLDPASYFKIGQIVEAKVHQLDFALERIFLSLKEITPDPLTEALESVVGGDNDQLGGRLQAAELDAEWPDVESLIKELEMVEGIQSVSKSRFFLSPGLAPTFQIYMAPMFENQYKLLARAGNRVQELIVEASLSKEEMKSTIMSCTNRVE